LQVDLLNLWLALPARI